MVRVLRGAPAAILALALSGAAPAGPGRPASRPVGAARGIDIGPAGPAIDWERIERNTREYQAALARHRRALEPVQFDKWPRKLLDHAQAAVPVPAMWERVQFPAPLSAEEREALQLAGREVALAQQFIDLGAANARARLDEADASFQKAKHREVLLERVAEQRALLEERVGKANQLANLVRMRIAERDATVWSRAKQFLQNQTYTDAGSELLQLRGLLAGWKAAPRTPILSAELSYVKGDLGSPPPTPGSAAPAYATASSELALEDTTEGREVELSPEVVAKAQELATPAAAYDFVKNQVRLDWYYGALKGSTQTLREQRGNDADLATLLVALLRAQGHPARYVRGTIQLPVAKVADLMGLLTEAELQALYSPVAGAPAFALPASKRNLVLQGLSAAGVPYQPVVAGGQVAAVELTHVWVEAFLGYADYRGAGRGVEGKQWVAIDPAIPGVGKYAASEPALDALAAMNKTASELTAAFLASAPDGTTAMQFFRGQVESWLAQNRPDVTYTQVLRRVDQKPESLNYIPGTLPYQVVSVLDELPFLPEDFKHRVHIVVSDASGPVLDYTAPLHQLLGHRSTLTYLAASDADEAAISAAGGIYRAPASIVQVRPVVRVDGVAKAAGTRSVGLGEDQAWKLELLLPNGGSKRIENRVVAGNLIALGFGGPRNLYSEPSAHVAGDEDGGAPVFMYGRAVAYANAWTASEDELAQLLQVVALRPTASVVFVENQLQVQQVLGLRQQVNWKGLEVDADLRTMAPLELAAGRGTALLRLSGYEGSSQEAKVLADGTGVAAISTVSLLQKANAAGVPVLSITAANAATELPKVSAAAEVLSEIADQLARGREILVPVQEQTIQDWTGTGFIARNPATEEGGYYLSGLVSGAQTIVSPGYWADEELVQTLESNPPPFTDDVTLARKILKIGSTDLQEAVVGSGIKELRVVVLTEDDRPVKGATVTFARMNAPAEAQLGFAGQRGDVSSQLNGTAEEILAQVRSTPASGTGVSVVTNDRGFAQVWATPDPSFEFSALYSTSGAQKQLLGLNKLSASVQAGSDWLLPGTGMSIPRGQ